MLSYIVLACMSFTLLVAVTELVKERRVRRALQQLLQRLLSQWRPHSDAQNRHSDDAPVRDAGRDGM